MVRRAPDRVKGRQAFPHFSHLLPNKPYKRNKRDKPNEPDKRNKRNKPNQPDRPSTPEKSLAEKTIEDILLLFGDTLKVARRRYRQFVKNGIDQGRRPDLQGGGLIRSSGGNKSGLLGRKKEDRELSDERVLGSGDFVAQVLEEANELEERRIKNKISLEELLQKVSADMEIELKELMSPSRRTKISMARAIVSYWAVREMGYPGIEIGRILNLTGPAVTKCVERGKKILDENEELKYKLIS